MLYCIWANQSMEDNYYKQLTHIKLNSCSCICLNSLDGFTIFTNDKTYNIARNRNLQKAKRAEHDICQTNYSSVICKVPAILLSLFPS